jgi:hypothetical protein
MFRQLTTRSRKVAGLVAVAGALLVASLVGTADAKAGGCFEVSSSIGGDIMSYCYQGSAWVPGAVLPMYYEQYRSYAWSTGQWANYRRYIYSANGRWNVLGCFADALGTYRQLSWCDF